MNLRAIIPALIVPAIFLIGWEVASRTGTLDPDVVSRPSQIAVAFVSIVHDGSIFAATLQTLQAAAFGLSIGLVVGVLLGIVLGLQPFAEIFSRPVLEMLRSIPSIAFMPLALLLFGFGLRMEGVIVAYACVWPILIATLAATRSIDIRLLEVAQTLEMSQARRLFKIILPSVLARVSVGLRTAIGFALVVSVTIEILSNPRGIGYSMIFALQSFRPDVVYAYLFWLAFLGFVLNWGSSFLGRGYATVRR